MADDEKERRARARRLREEVERLRSGADRAPEPKSPREFLDREAGERKRRRESGKKDRDEG